MKEINELTKEEFDKEFNERMPKIPLEQQLTKEVFLQILVMKGILRLDKFIEFLNPTYNEHTEKI